jgi:glycosyltransferase involved in cell wall biosynthesis
LLLSASESHLPQHATTHNLFRHAPAGYLKVTVQHGFECVGFRHSANHVRAHGATASFAADILCAWLGHDQLTSMAESQRAKVLVTGPTSVLQMRTGVIERPEGAPGLVCENLHSVRFKQTGRLKVEFVKTFTEFARIIAVKKKRVTLRPHPGGQYVLRNKVALPPNVDLENAPMYRLDLRSFAYGISAPSSVLIDMLLAEIPTAVWRDRRGDVDADSYSGLHAVCSPRDWAEFAQAAVEDREAILSRQRRFLQGTGMPLDPREVFSRFAELFSAATRLEVRGAGSQPERERILFIHDGERSKLRTGFEQPLEPLVASGAVVTRAWAAAQLESGFGDTADLADSIKSHLNSFNPSIIVFCEASGRACGPILDWARQERVPVVHHIEDDLLAGPTDRQEPKLAKLLSSSDLVYAATETLKRRLLRRFPDLAIVAGKIQRPRAILRRPVRRRARKIGYIASAHQPGDLEQVAPAIERLLQSCPDVELQLLGSTHVPERLQGFASRITTTPLDANREDFLDDLVRLEWDIGICPLVPRHSARVHKDTEWLDYTAVGAAVVASKGAVYDELCAGGCGFLANSVEDWLSALDLLVNNVDERLAIAERAQAKLEQQFGIARLREQVLGVIAQGHAAAAARRELNREEELPVCQLR